VPRSTQCRSGRREFVQPEEFGVTVESEAEPPARVDDDVTPNGGTI
jgi:hypothetical protein